MNRVVPPLPIVAPGDLVVGGADGKPARMPAGPAGTVPVSTGAGVAFAQVPVGAHDHDGRYYTEAEVDAALATKANAASLGAHTGDTNNPHAVTKAQVGLGNVPDVDATARANHTGTQAASTIGSGTLSTARLGSGTASATTFLRGDQTWAVPAGAVETRTVAYQQETPTVASTTDATNWSTWLTTAEVLPSGTWEASLQFNGAYLSTAAAGGPEVRAVAGSVTGAGIRFVTAVSSRSVASCAAKGTFASDGTTATTFRIEYRRRSDFTGTPNAEGGSILVVLRKVG